MKKKNLFIVGAGDFGREMESWLDLLPDFNEKYTVAGYLDDNLDALKEYPSDYKIIGKPLEYAFGEDDCILMSVSNPVTKKILVEGLKQKAEFYTFIAPNAIIAKFVNIGQGSIVCPNAIIATNVEIGECVIINGGTQIGHDAKIGSFSSLMANADLGGHVELSEGVYIGTNATIIPGKRIAENILIGAGSIVIKNLYKQGSYFGNPAKLISY